MIHLLTQRFVLVSVFVNILKESNIDLVSEESFVIINLSISFGNSNIGLQ